MGEQHVAISFAAPFAKTIFDLGSIDDDPSTRPLPNGARIGFCCPVPAGKPPARRHLHRGAAFCVVAPFTLQYGNCEANGKRSAAFSTCEFAHPLRCTQCQNRVMAHCPVPLAFWGKYLFRLCFNYQKGHCRTKSMMIYPAEQPVFSRMALTGTSSSPHEREQVDGLGFFLEYDQVCKRLKICCIPGFGVAIR